MIAKLLLRRGRLLRQTIHLTNISPTECKHGIVTKLHSLLSKKWLFSEITCKRVYIRQRAFNLHVRKKEETLNEKLNSSVLKNTVTGRNMTQRSIHSAQQHDSILQSTNRYNRFQSASEN